MAVEAVHTVTLWVLFTYLLDAFETSPRLAITAPQKRCGKTTLLSLLYQLSCRPLAAANLTPAVAFRVIEAARPTLLIDETDTFVKENDELRGILNSGHSRATAFVIRCQGEDNQPRCFSTWAAQYQHPSHRGHGNLKCMTGARLKRLLINYESGALHGVVSVLSSQDIVSRSKAALPNRGMRARGADAKVGPRR